MRDLDLICVLAAICSSGTNHSAGAAVNMAEGIVAEVKRRNPGYAPGISQTEETVPISSAAYRAELGENQTGYRSDAYGGTR
jgi:hypothetical protein